MGRLAHACRYACWVFVGMSVCAIQCDCGCWECVTHTHTPHTWQSGVTQLQGWQCSVCRFAWVDTAQRHNRRRPCTCGAGCSVQVPVAAACVIHAGLQPTGYARRVDASSPSWSVRARRRGMRSRMSPELQAWGKAGGGRQEAAGGLRS